MRSLGNEANNKGFTLVELIVVIAIMVVVAGMSTLSVSILTGSDAKQACEKISAQLNEVKTGSMSRYSEDLNIVFVEDPTAYDWADKKGYYAVKQITTMTKNSSTGMPEEELLSVEHRYICSSRVSMDFQYSTGSCEVTPEDGKGIGFTFDRATGLFGNVKTNLSVQADGSVSTATVNAEPKNLDIKSGLKTYHIRFINETGKHEIYK